MSKYCIARPYDEVAINEELEYVLDDEGDVMYFSSKEEAEDFLRKNGFDDEMIEEVLIIEEESE